MVAYSKEDIVRRSQTYQSIFYVVQALVETCWKKFNLNITFGTQFKIHFYFQYVIL